MHMAETTVVIFTERDATFQVFCCQLCFRIYFLWIFP